MNMENAKTALTAAASLAATAMLVRSVAKDLIPHELQSYFFSSFHSILSRFSNQITITIDEYDGFELNQIYAAAEIYLGSIFSANTAGAKKLKVNKPVKDKNILIVAGEDQVILDRFQGIDLKWTPSHKESESMTHHSRDYGSSFKLYARFFILSFHKKHQEQVLHSYLPHILSQYKSMKEAQKGVKLHTIRDDRFHHSGQSDPWISINLDHPSTFHTLAMDPELKEEVMADLDRFVARKDYYRKVGKAWKRGYLLFGPPGTGKSSLIAAMANYLNFSIYDLELADVQSNNQLRKLIVSTANRSILVVEDIDCSIDLKDREEDDQPVRRRRMNGYENQVTLSGLLNFIDGIWSSCGDERIIIFTTNHKEKLDAALLRPGRMDMHIHMSYCKYSAFKVLAANYLSIQHHSLFTEVEALIEEVDVTPAEVAEELMKSDDTDIALKGFIKFLYGKKLAATEEKERAEKVAGEGEDGEGKDIVNEKDKDIIEGVNDKHE